MSDPTARELAGGLNLEANYIEGHGYTVQAELMRHAAEMLEAPCYHTCPSCNSRTKYPKAGAPGNLCWKCYTPLVGIGTSVTDWTCPKGCGLPQSIAGIDPDFTDGKDSVEWLREKWAGLDAEQIRERVFADGKLDRSSTDYEPHIVRRVLDQVQIILGQAQVDLRSSQLLERLDRKTKPNDPCEFCGKPVLADSDGTSQCSDDDCNRRQSGPADPAPQPPADGAPDLESVAMSYYNEGELSDESRDQDRDDLGVGIHNPDGDGSSVGSGQDVTAIVPDLDAMLCELCTDLNTYKANLGYELRDRLRAAFAKVALKEAEFYMLRWRDTNHNWATKSVRIAQLRREVGG